MEQPLSAYGAADSYVVPDSYGPPKEDPDSYGTPVGPLLQEEPSDSYFQPEAPQEQGQILEKG